MDSEEKKAKGLDARYLAGIFDGEGCVRISSDSRWNSYFIHVQVANKNEEVVYAHRSMFGGTVSRIARKSEKLSGYFVWHSVCRDAAAYLKAILPHVITKRKQVELALKFDEEVAASKSFGRRGMSKEEADRREAVKLELSKMKREDVVDHGNYAEHLPYVAGLVDGEGCIQVYSSRKRYCLSLIVGNTDKRMVESLQGNYGGCIVKIKMHSQKHRQAWHWILQGDAVADLLKKLLPSMIIKKPQAELACQFQALRRCGDKSFHEEFGQLYKKRISALNQAKFTA